MSKGALAFAMMVHSANEDSLVICAEYLNLLQVERTEEAVLDLFAEAREVFLEGFSEEEYQLNVEIILLSKLFLHSES